MSLFPVEFDSTQNLLRYDGCVHYHGQIMEVAEADHYLQLLLESIAWQNDLAVIFGKTIVTKRKVAWYADQAFSYTYSKTTKQALPWMPELLALKALVEVKTGERFNACLLNLYHSGEEGMAWHSDAERELKSYAAIASLSLGAERKFAFKHKNTQEKVELQLAHGSLLVMKDQTQIHWLHCLPPTKKVQELRVNLTFRMMNDTQ